MAKFEVPALHELFALCIFCRWGVYLGGMQICRRVGRSGWSVRTDCSFGSLNFLQTGWGTAISCLEFGERGSAGVGSSARGRQNGECPVRA